MSKRRIAIASAALLSAAACQTYTDNAGALIESERTTVPDAWDTAIDVQPSNVRSWAEAFGDELLKDYLGRAQVGNFDLKLAETQYARAVANVARAEAGLAPRLTYNGGAAVRTSLDDIGDTGESFSLGLSSSFDTDIFGLNKANVAQADAARTAALAQLEDTRQRTNAAIVTAFYDAVEANLLLALARDNLAFQSDTFKIAEVRFKNGATARDSYVLAQSEYQTALGAIETQAANVRDTRRRLSTLIGDYPDAKLPIANNFAAISALPVRDIPATVIENRPDLQARAADVEAAYISLWRTQRENWPGINLTAGLTGNAGDISDIFDPASFIASLGAGLFGTAFDGGLNKANREDATAALDASVLRYGQTLRTAIAEIESAYDRADALRRALEFNQNAAAAANEALQIEQLKFEAGDSELLDVLTIQRRVNSINAALIRTQGDLIDATVETYRVTGRASAE